MLLTGGLDKMFVSLLSVFEKASHTAINKLFDKNLCDQMGFNMMILFYL